MDFTMGGLGHVVSVICFVLFIILAILIGRYYKKNRKEKNFLVLFSLLSIIFWIYMQIWYLKPENFDPYVSYPLHVCDILVPISIITLLVKSSWLRSIVYYWGVVFTIQAFITPASDFGPSHTRYWLFWVSHSIIIFAVLYLLIIKKYNPNIRDYFKSLISICVYAIIITPLNLLNGWNYGYIGNNKPETPSVVDILGPWPLRLIWMFLLVVILFYIATTPFMVYSKITDNHDHNNENN